MSDSIRSDELKTAAEGVEVYTDGIYFYLDEWKDINGVKDMEKISQSKWNACLLYIHDHAFKDTSALRNRYDCNAYDVFKVNRILDIYMSLCFSYGKEVSIRGFTFLTGITDDTIFNWGKTRGRVSRTGFEIYKKLTENHEESLRNHLYDKGGSLGGVVLVNHDFAYNMPGGGAANVAPIESRADISAKLGLMLSDNSSHPAEIEAQEN